MNEVRQRKRRIPKDQIDLKFLCKSDNVRVAKKLNVSHETVSRVRNGWHVNPTIMAELKKLNEENRQAYL
jgi:hypothetical protein